MPLLSNQEFACLSPVRIQSCRDKNDWNDGISPREYTHPTDLRSHLVDPLVSRARIQRVSSDMNGTTRHIDRATFRKSQSTIFSSCRDICPSSLLPHDAPLIWRQDLIARLSSQCQQDIINSHRRIVESDNHHLLDVSVQSTHSSRLNHQDKCANEITYQKLSIPIHDAYSINACPISEGRTIASTSPIGKFVGTREFPDVETYDSLYLPEEINYSAKSGNNVFKSPTESRKDLHSRATVWSRAALTPACAILMQKVLDQFDKSSKSSYSRTRSCPLGESENSCAIARSISQKDMTPRKARCGGRSRSTYDDQSTSPLETDRKRKVTPLHIMRCVYFDLAATTIQRIWRGYVGKKLAAYKRVKVVADNLLNHSATIIQSVWRGNRARWQIYLLFHIRMHAVARHTAATRIQRAWRNWKRFLLIKIEQLTTVISGMRNLSAIIIQKAWRGYQVRKIVDEEWKYWVVKWVWDPPGRMIEVLGDFTDPPWTVRIPMTFCPYRRCYVAKLPRKQCRCELKFSVENRFVCCGAGTVIEDGSGHYNNLVDVFDVPADSPFLRGRRTVKALRYQSAEFQQEFAIPENSAQNGNESDHTGHETSELSSDESEIDVARSVAYTDHGSDDVIDLTDNNNNINESDDNVIEEEIQIAHDLDTNNNIVESVTQLACDPSNSHSYSQTSDEPLTSIDSQCISERPNLSDGDQERPEEDMGVAEEHVSAESDDNDVMKINENVCIIGDDAVEPDDGILRLEEMKAKALSISNEENSRNESTNEPSIMCMGSFSNRQEDLSNLGQEDVKSSSPSPTVTRNCRRRRKNKRKYSRK